MDQILTIPSPQKKYLEPYRNRVFQYDTKNSNLFLSHYVNQILNVVGDNVIVRGLGVTPNITKDQKGIEFIIEPGALIQDLTYFEFSQENKLLIEDVTLLPNLYLVLYTNWKYIQTVYDNPLKFEAAFYNPETKKTLSPWDVNTNRIILGIFKFNLSDKLKLTNVEKVDIKDVVFEDTNVVQNSSFEENTTKHWTGVNATLRVEEEEDQKFLNVVPIANDLSGVSQTVTTRPNSDYELSFLMRSEKVLPFKVLVLDGTVATYDPSQEYNEIVTFNETSTPEWKEFKLRFHALSNKNTIVFLKTDTQELATFNLADILCVEYQMNEPVTNVNKITFIDGGNLNDALNTAPEALPDMPEYPVEYRSSFAYEGVTNGETEYPLPSNLRLFNSGVVLVFLDGSLLNPNDYSLDGAAQLLRFNFTPNPNTPFIVCQITMVDKNFTDEISVKRFISKLQPRLTQYNLNFPNAFAEGSYLPFFESVLLDQDDFRVSNVNNTIALKFRPTVSCPFDILYLNNEALPLMVKSLNVVQNIRNYTLDYEPDPVLTLVFWGATLLNRGDYGFNGSQLVLNFSPEEDGKLQIITLVKTETFNPKIWYFAADQLNTVYQNPTFFTAPIGNYQVFCDSILLGEEDYSISLLDKTISFNFTPDPEGSFITVVCYDTGSEITLTNGNTWIYSLVAGETEYDIPQLIVDYFYLIFTGGILLSDNDYTINKQKITLKTPLTRGDLVIAAFKNEPGKIKEINLTTTTSQTYIITALLQQVFVFYGGVLLRQSDYTISNNKLTLKFVPVANKSLKVFSVEAS